MYLSEAEGRRYGEDQDLGFLKKIHKLHKKLGGKIEKKIAKVLPKPLRKIEEKRFALEDKIAYNKTLNKITNVVAVAVAAYFVGPYAMTLLKSAAPTLIKAAVGKAVQDKMADKQQAASASEAAAIQAEIDALQKQQAEQAAIDAKSAEMVTKGYVPVQQEDGTVIYMPNPRVQMSPTYQPPPALPVMQPGGQMTMMPYEHAAQAASGESFMDKYKWPLLGAVGLGALLLMNMRRK